MRLGGAGRCSIRTGEIEERGRLPGRMKFAGEGMYPNALVVLGMEKSCGMLAFQPMIGGCRKGEKGEGELAVEVVYARSSHYS